MTQIDKGTQFCSGLSLVTFEWGEGEIAVATCVDAVTKGDEFPLFRSLRDKKWMTGILKD